MLDLIINYFATCIFIVIWALLMVFSHIMKDIFIKLMVVPASVILGIYLMGLDDMAINKVFGTVVIVIGVYFLYDAGADFLRNRKG